MVRRFRVQLGVLNSQKCAVRVEDLRYRLGHLTDAYSALTRRLDDLVVDVGEVHHLEYFPPSEREYAAEQIFEHERPKIAEVRRLVDGRAAGVDANGFPILGRKRFDLAGERVVEAEIGRHALKLAA